MGDDRFFGKYCPVGMVQVEFVGAGEPYSKHGWKPTKQAFIEIYVDGQRFRIEIGTMWNGRRGLHVMGPTRMVVERSAMNAVEVALPDAVPKP